MDKIEVTLSNNAYHLGLLTAKKFGNLPSELKFYFDNNQWQVDQNSDLIKSTKYDEWYIFDYAPQQIELYKITYKRAGAIGYVLDVERATPTHSGNNINRYPMYKVGLPFKKDQSLFISGWEREELELKEGIDSRKLKKWDYFFLASTQALIAGHQQMIYELQTIEKEHDELFKKLTLRIGLSVLLFFAAFFYLWAWLVFILTLVLAYRFRATLFAAYNSYQAIQKLKSASERVRNEQDELVRQVYQSNETHSTMRRWLAEDINKLDQKAAAELGLNNEYIERPDKIDNPIGVPNSKRIVGLKIVEWGISQPISTNGKREIEKKYWYHLRALRWAEPEPVLGVYYLTFIYLTHDHINFCGFFYDFIQERSHGTYTKQIHYRDIVSIGTREESDQILSNFEEQQIKRIIIESKSGGSISIALTEIVTIENIQEQIQNKMEKNREMDTPDFEKLTSQKETNWLPATGANYVLTNLRTYWNERKRLDNLPPQDNVPRLTE